MTGGLAPLSFLLRKVTVAASAAPDTNTTARCLDASVREWTDDSSSQGLFINDLVATFRQVL